MSDEPKEDTVADEATDESLAAAWDEAVNKDKKEEPQKEEVKAAPSAEKPKEEEEKKPPEEKPASAKTPEELKAEEQHKEDSRLGRKVKGLEERVAQLLKKLESSPAPTDEPEVVSTPDDVRNVMRATMEKTQREQMEYEANYLKQVQQLKAGEDDDELYDEVVAELTRPDSPFNVKYSENAFADARVNFAEAKVAVMKAKYTGKKSPVPQRERAEVPPVGPAAAASRETAKATVLPKLDKFAQDYVDYLMENNVSEEEIAASLAEK